MPVSTEVAQLWRQRWRDRRPAIAVLAVGLGVLTSVLVVEDAVVRRRRPYEALRIAFLEVTVVNVLTFAESIMTEFRRDFFLLEPLIERRKRREARAAARSAAGAEA
jgi:hypothetical protein